METCRKWRSLSAPWRVIGGRLAAVGFVEAADGVISPSGLGAGRCCTGGVGTWWSDGACRIWRGTVNSLHGVWPVRSAPERQWEEVGMESQEEQSPREAGEETV